MHRITGLTPLTFLLAASTVIGTLNAPSVAYAQDADMPQTRAERTDYVETSRYADVVAFSEQVAAASPLLEYTHFGYTEEGRRLPLVIFGDVENAVARIYVQGNIHAGEVCGKEAVLMLLRDLAEGQRTHLADSLAILFAPIYNADGNERVALTNRGVQNGPTGGMGQRPNALGLDLNRDHMKADSPEARSLLRLVNAYDPHVMVDLHTTNGTRHGYHLTYAPPLHPNTPKEIDTFLRERWLPAVTEEIRRVDGWEYYHYGNVPRRGEPGWYTFDHRPRFSNNYAGLRNRFGILSEAYAYLTFEDRVRATKRFVEEILEFAHAHAGEIADITRAADALPVPGTELAVTAEYRRSAVKTDILMGEVIEERNPWSGRPLLRRTDNVRREPMYEYTAFKPVELVRAPDAYIIPPNERDAISRLHAHGIEMEELTAERASALSASVALEQYRVDSVQVATREYQSRYARQWFGRWERGAAQIETGFVLVELDQPKGRLAFSLLEPRSDDGLAAWGIIGAGATGRDETDQRPVWYPVLRVGHN